jgi:Uma2 family endonuclease
MTPRVGMDPARLKLIYEWDAQRYLESLPPEHFMEATSQATQRKITVESFDLIHQARPDVHVFNELLVQYAVRGGDPDRPERVVPDNMVVVHPGPIVADTSYMLPLQPAGPFLVLEYVSKSNKRKDYDDNYHRYERELKVPYYLLFYPDNEELSVYHRKKLRYTSLLPNTEGRISIPELELGVAIHKGWVRFWFRGELVPLPTELKQQADRAEQRATTAERRATAAERRADQERQARLALEAELARLRTEMAKSKPG